jgi:type VI secretion system protein ImpJ
MSAAPVDRSNRPRRRTADDVASAVYWTEGMLLAPQHFQLASKRSEELLHYHASVLSPFHWGLIELDPPQLKDGELTILSLEAVMPDGLIVSHPGKGGSDLTIKLTEHIEAIQGKAQTIFLTVEAHRKGVRFDQRYKHSNQQVNDETSAEDDLSVEVEVLQPKIQLTFAGDLANSSIALPIARVEMGGNAVVLSKYEAPWLQVRNGSVLHAICDKLAAELRWKADSLAKSIKDSSESLHGAQLLETRMLIHSMVSGLPALEALIDSDAAHPFSLYLALASIAGNLAPGTVPPRLPAYDHDDLLRVFADVDRKIRKIMKQAIHAPFELHTFDFRGDAFRLRLRKAWAGHELMLGVRAPEGANLADVDQWVNECTIGESDDALDNLLLNRSIGLKRKRVTDSALPPSSGVVLYELKTPAAGSFDGERELVIKNDNPGRPAEIQLYVTTMEK